MRDEQKKIITQWMFPTIVIVVIIIGMIINFNSRSSTMAVGTISKELIVVSERYADELRNDLVLMSKLTVSVAEAVHNINSLNENASDAVVNMLHSLFDQSPAYQAVLIDDTGAGVSHTGASINLSGAAYFEELQERGTNSFLYVEEDGISGSGSKAIIYFTRVTGASEEMLISYYPLDKIGGNIDKGIFDGDILFLLLSDAGELLSHNAKASKYIRDDLISVLRSNFASDLRKMDIRLKNGYSDTMKVEVDGEKRSLVYTPLLDDWYVMTGINEGYVSILERRVWEFTRKTFFQLALVICGFAVCMVLVNMVAKIRGTSKTKELIVKADTDLLTGLLNKVATEKRVMEYMEAFPDEQAIMYVLDIDNFKKINDTMGHAFGDEVLRSLGQQITPIFRSTDIIGRIGGDELIILLKNVNNDESLLRESEKVARFFHEFKAGEYVKYSATASIGAAIFPRDGRDFESMYKAADQALYTAKKRGKNQLAFYHDTFGAVVIKN